MGDYNVNVAAVRLPTGTKLVRLCATMPSGEFTSAVLFSPDVARAVAKALLEAARNAESIIELPNAQFPGLSINDLTKES